MVDCTTFSKHGFEKISEAARFATLHDEAGEDLGRIRGRIFDRVTGRAEYFVVEYGCDRQILVPRDLLRESGSGYETRLTKDDLDRLPAFDLNLLKDYRQWRAYRELHRMVLRNTEGKRFRAA